MTMQSGPNSKNELHGINKVLKKRSKILNEITHREKAERVRRQE